MKGGADWSLLPSELLHSISGKLCGIEDYARFRSVCKSWLSAAAPSDLPPQLPWLMLPPKLPEKDGGEAEYSATHDFFSLADHKLHRLHLPETRNKICHSAGHGWLLVTGRKPDLFMPGPAKDPEMFLLHPLTRARIPLPPRAEVLGGKTVPYVADIFGTLFYGSCGKIIRSRRELCTWFVDKAVLSSNPATSADWTLAVVLNNTFKLAFYRPGDTSWKVTDHKLSLNHFVTHFNGSFYVCGCQKILVTELSSSREIVYPVREHFYHCCHRRNYRRDYLVQSAGELLLIERYEICTNEGGVSAEKELFDVFRMDSTGEKSSWSQVHSLGDHALFVSHNVSLSVSVADLPGCFRPNCIYFTDQDDIFDLIEDDRHIGVFSLEDSSIKLLHCCQDDSPKPWKASWILPNLF